MTEQEILAAAISYALQAATLVVPGCLDLPTPCPGWDLRALLLHLSASMAAIEEALAIGQLSPDDPESASLEDPVEVLRDRAAGLLIATFISPHESARIAGVPVPVALVRATGALETAVHGWDIYAACGRRRPIPPGIAVPLLDALSRLIPSRDGLFAGPVATPLCACPGDRLVAALGRTIPARRHHALPEFDRVVQVKVGRSDPA